MDPKKTTPPPPEFTHGCKAALDAAEELDTKSDRAAQVLRERRRSGRFPAPPPRPRRSVPSAPLAFRRAFVAVG